jgi:cytidyltransferase-like protein
MAIVTVIGAFDDIRLKQVRFLQEAARLGELHVTVWSDALIAAESGSLPKFPADERLYFIQSLRFVASARVADGKAPSKTDVWVMMRDEMSPERNRYCVEHGIRCAIIGEEQLNGFPLPQGAALPAKNKKVLVTGCYDWLHTGHIRFFEEVSEYGDLYVVVGHDANIALLKGAGHPQFPDEQRRYMVAAIRFVTEAMVSTGDGWLDAEPEIERIRPDIYAVNEDGDRPEKRDYCNANGIEYLVLKRLPKPGLPRRQSTVLRGF